VTKKANSRGASLLECGIAVCSCGRSGDTKRALETNRASIGGERIGHLERRLF
jgi:hypothetical protein